MASDDGLYKRGNVWWLRSDPLEGGRISTGKKDKQAAKLWRGERERLAASPVYRASTAATVGQWVRNVLTLKRTERSAGTLHMYGVKLGHVLRILTPQLTMAKLDAEAIDKYIAQRREEGAGSNTIARELTCLRQLMRHAKRKGQYPHDISTVMPIGFSAEYVPVTRVLQREDLPTLMYALRNDTERAWVCMALTFAADAADIHRMRPEDYDRSRNLFHVRGTKNRARDAWLPVLPMFSELFDWALPRLPLEWSRSSKGVGEACARASLPHLSPKDLRRTTITWLAEGGVEQSIASRFARHLGDQMVRKVYAQVSPRALGSLIVSQLGTDSSHPISGPLGGMADAGDLKGPDRPSADSENNNLASLNVAERRPAEAASGTGSSQQIAAASALLLLSRVLGPCGMAVAS